MNRRHAQFRAGLPAAAVVALAAWFAVPQGPAAPNIAKDVAVCDMDAVLASYPGVQLREDAINAKNEVWKQTVDAVQAELATAEADRATFVEGTSEFDQVELQWQLMQLKLQKTIEMVQAEAARARRKIAIDLYGEIQRGIAAFAKQNGLKLVLRLRANRAGVPPRVQFDTNLRRDVIYADGALDVTKRVVMFLKNWKPNARPDGGAKVPRDSP